MPRAQTYEGTNNSRSTLLQARLLKAKQAFSTRNLNLVDAARLVRTGTAPKAGDVVLAQVISVGQHARLENIHGRRGDLYEADEIIVAYGNRYAPDQFEAHVPDSLDVCDLIAGGGIASAMITKHAAMKHPTQIEPIGLLVGADGVTLNLRDFAFTKNNGAELANLGLRPKTVIAVIGSSMNAGKTTTAAGLVHGLTKAGFRVGAAKLTGTGSGGDLWQMRDAGAVAAFDFTDAGYATTFKTETADLSHISNTLLAALANKQVEIAVVEIADGLLHSETAELVGLGKSNNWFDGFVFAAADAMGAVFGVSWLAKRGIEPLAVSGLLSASPLAMKEAAGMFSTPVATLQQLRDPVTATKIAFGAGQLRVVA